MDNTKTFSDSEKEFFRNFPIFKPSPGFESPVKIAKDAYNKLFGTNLTIEEFVARYTDFFRSFLEDHIGSDPLVSMFLEEHKEQKCPSVEKLLNEYEAWRKGRVENESKKKEEEKPTASFPFFDTFIPIEKENKYSDPIKDITFKFLDI